MHATTTGDHVRLTQNLPELGLQCGQVGLVCSTWLSPAAAYEVEFESVVGGFPTRVLLLPNQIEQVEDQKAGR